MPNSVEIDGLDEATSRLDEAGDILSQAIADALSAAGDAFVNDAQSNAPVDTGFLRDNIEITSTSDRELVIESQADYSGFVEYGTRKMQAQPFFFQASDSAIQEMELAMSNILL